MLLHLEKSILSLGQPNKSFCVNKICFGDKGVLFAKKKVNLYDKRYTK